MVRLTLRALLAVLLVGSALLFVVGIYVERGVSPSEPPVVSAPSSQPEASPGEGGEQGGEAGHSEAPAASEGEAGETSEQRAAEARPFGIDLESPVLVGGAMVFSLLLAVGVLRTSTPLVPVAIVLFAMVFALLDALEASYQLNASRSGLALVALLLVVLHLVAGFIASQLVRRRRAAPPSM